MPKYKVKWVDRDTREKRLEVYPSNARGTVSESGRERLSVFDSEIFKEMERDGNHKCVISDIDMEGDPIDD